MLFKATPERKQVFEGVLSFSDLCSLLQKQEESGKCLEFSKDVHAMRYVDGEREDVERDPFSPLESGEAADIFEAGATFQVFIDRLAKHLVRKVIYTGHSMLLQPHYA